MEPRRSLLRLSWAFGLTWLCVTMLAAPGPAAWVSLSGSQAQAGAYFGLLALSSAIGAAIGGRMMDRHGRRPVLVFVNVQAAAGFAIAGLAYAYGSLLVFGIGTAIASMAIGVVYLTRLAAGELAPPAQRARTVALVQVSATAGAVAGPFLLLAITPVAAPIGIKADILLWAIGPIAFLVGAALVRGARGLRGPSALPSAAGPAAAATKTPMLPFLAGAAALVCAQAAMVTVMGVTGVHLRHLHGATPTALVMAGHFVGMFGLSLVVGRLADRVGRAPTIAAGLLLLAVGGGSIAFLDGALGLGAGLLLVGLGWSFSYISGTVLLTDVIAPDRRARVMGGVDFTTAIITSTASLSGGVWYATHGIEGLGLAAAAFASLPIVFVLLARKRAGSDDADRAAA